MSLSKLSIRRPVTIFMVFLGVVLLGLISYNRLPQELFPPITYPQITVATFYKDAAPEEMEILVTRPLEETIGTVSGLRKVSSVSKEELSLIIAEFNWGKNMDFAALGVREKIDLVKERLPRGSEDPVVMKFNPFELPVAVLNVTGRGTSPGGLLQITKKLIKNEMEKTDGVAVVNINGGQEREILIEVDQGRLKASGLSVVTVSDALKKANLNYPAGTIEEEFYEYLIRTIGEFKAVKEIREIPIAVERAPDESGQEGGAHGSDIERNRRLVLMKDIAQVKDTFKEKTSVSRYNRKDNVSVAVIKQAGANTIFVARNIKQTLKELRQDLPKDIDVSIVYDQSEFIKDSIKGVRDAAVIGGILAFIVLFIFLRNAASALIVTVSIPISILAVFSLMYFTGISLNMISLGGLALGVGMLVDNGIVVLENIFRHRQLGLPAKEASVKGANEVAAAIFGSTLTTIAVFLPMAFVVGIAGQLFKELAFTVVFSLLSSLFVALTLIPVLAAKVGTSVDSRQKHSGATKLSEHSGATGKISPSPLPSPQRGEGVDDEASAFQRGYGGILRMFLNNKFVSLFTIFVVFLIFIKMFAGLDREFLPKVDQGRFIIKAELPPGTKLDITDGVVARIEDTLFAFDTTKSVAVSIGSRKEEETTQGSIETLGSHQARIMVELKKERDISTSEFLQRFKNDIGEKSLEGAQIEYVLQESIFQAAFEASAPVTIEIKGDSLSKLKKASEYIQKRLQRINGIYGVRSSLVARAPEAKVFVRKDKAAQYNLSVSDIAITAQTAMKGFVATEFKEAGREIDIRVRLREKDRKDISKIDRLIVHSPLDIEVPLGDVAGLGIGKGPSQIQRLDQQRVIIISANVFKRGFGEVADDVNKLLAKVSGSLPPGYSAELTGEHLNMQESFNSLRFALILSLVLVCMIMAAEFESLWQPLIIIFTFPLSLIGVAAGLSITRTPLSVMVVLGVIVLGGIVVNNGIVLIDYVNTLRRRDGYAVVPALIKASQTRLRPIMMTAMTTIFALLPLALGLSKGAEIQIPMAITVMGGLLLSTFLSLVVIPAIYLSFTIMLGFIMRRPVEEVKEDITVIEMPPPPAEVKKEPKPPEKKRPPKKKKEKEEQPEEKARPRTPTLPARLNVPGLNRRQRQVLAHLLKNKSITRAAYVETFGTSVPTAARDLKGLVDKGLIRGIGPQARGRYYELV